MLSIIYYRRWCVLTLNNIFTFKAEKEYTKPTETINVSNIKTVRSDENSSSNIFVRLFHLEN